MFRHRLWLCRYIKTKQDAYEEGTSSGSLTANKLMQLAKEKYKVRTVQGKWNAPSLEEEKIMVLEARLNKLDNSKRTPKGSNDGKRGQPGKRKHQQKDEEKKKTTKYLPKPEWMNEEPTKEDLFKPKMWNNKKWWYCSEKTGGKCDGKYRIHKPSDCHGTGKSTKNRGGSNGNTKKVVINEAINQITGGYQSDE
uniref:Uncharacterized protein n=1 Tax=Grammatophora oceanica TaxID=210454 RepID=A0A7S1YA70_9STRA|mmetsp:Transcript_35132/g.52222  ORF Transcript_35132/g.52222 Transcript_35132/m.52222 type:complete len:194 (+) Transcript_35132:838-1419(+)